MADLFSIVALVGGALLLVFLIVSVLFFNTVMNNQLPLTTQSSAMFWLAIVWAALLFGFLIWCFVRLFMGTGSCALPEPEPEEYCAREYEMQPIQYQPVPQQQLQRPITVTQQQQIMPVPANTTQGWPKSQYNYGSGGQGVSQS